MANTYLAGEQTKRNILRESKKLFYKKGYTETTYNDISAVAKVNRALIPYHFKNKQILGLEIYNQIIAEFYELIDKKVKQEKSLKMRAKKARFAKKQEEKRKNEEQK